MYWCQTGKTQQRIRPRVCPWSDSVTPVRALFFCCPRYQSILMITWYQRERKTAHRPPQFLYSFPILTFCNHFPTCFLSQKKQRKGRFQVPKGKSHLWAWPADTQTPTPTVLSPAGLRAVTSQLTLYWRLISLAISLVVHQVMAPPLQPLYTGLFANSQSEKNPHSLGISPALCSSPFAAFPFPSHF